ncbi:MAG: TIGR03087 family PEP-CTERM/XrtA system glycosyltransferase [Sphingomonadaceae bacterium]
MGEILFLAHRIPFPPDRGDKIRSHHLLRALAKLAPVHVACFADTDGDWQQEAELKQLAASYCFYERSKPLWRAGLEALASGKPVSLTAFDHAAMHCCVRKLVAKRGIDTIVVFSGQMGQYIPPDFDGRVVVDLCDVDSAKFEAYGKTGRWPRRWIDAREAPLLAAEEARLAERAHATLLISENEAELFRSRLPAGQEANIAVLRNGIDHAFYDPQMVRPNAELANSKGPHFVFTGQMDYAPNVAAAQRVIDRILPAIRAHHPEAQFHVVGRAPVAQLRAQDGKGGVHVWGEVFDVRPFIAAADIVLAPLEIARGIQNKVLEAMAMARPVLLTPEAATGIDATDGEHFAVAADDAALVGRALALLADGPGSLAMAAAARRYVVDQQDWSAMLAGLPELLGHRLPGNRRDAA